jgi:putative sigma-54 modulation protein
MQSKNINTPITITGRHMTVTDAIRDYVVKKVEGLHLDHPRIIEAKVVLAFHQHHHRQICEIILYCANHITIDASSESIEDLYAAIDDTISKIARRMRKHKTRLQRHARARHNQSIRHLTEHVFAENVLDKHEEEVEPLLIHPEPLKVKPLYPDEAIMELELSDRPFVLFHNQRTDKLSLIYRRKDGDYGMVEPDDNQSNHGDSRVA